MAKEHLTNTSIKNKKAHDTLPSRKKTNQVQHETAHIIQSQPDPASPAALTFPYMFLQHFINLRLPAFSFRPEKRQHLRA